MKINLPRPCSTHYLEYVTGYIHRKEKCVSIDIITTATIVHNNILIPVISSVINYFIRVRVIFFNIAFNNISAISWGSVLLVEETGVTDENH